LLEKRTSFAPTEFSDVILTLSSDPITFINDFPEEIATSNSSTCEESARIVIDIAETWCTQGRPARETLIPLIFLFHLHNVLNGRKFIEGFSRTILFMFAASPLSSLREGFHWFHFTESACDIPQDFSSLQTTSSLVFAPALVRRPDHDP
jgi:hypothetical protein